MMSRAFFNGAIVDTASARVGVDDGGWLHGAGLFETMRAENGRVFRLEQHVSRLMKSAEVLLRPLQRDKLPTQRDCGELLEASELSVARLRLTVSAGSLLATGGDDAPLNVCVTATELGAYPAKLYESGVGVIISPYQVSSTDPLAGHKTTCYLPRLLALRAAQSVRRTEALWFTTERRLAEGSISNVFLVRDGGLLTPPVDTPVLPGIARGVVLKSAERAAITVRQEPLTIDDVLGADEIFLTSSIMQVLPVTSVEKHTVGDGSVGPITEKLRTAFRETVKLECGH